MQMHSIAGTWRILCQSPNHPSLPSMAFLKDGPCNKPKTFGYRPVPRLCYGVLGQWGVGLFPP